ncbi:MAG: DegQ family serine endoprotease [Pseudomonadota bacterium]
MNLRRLPSSLFLALFLSAAAGTAYSALPLQVDGQPLPSLAPLVKKSSPAVVNIQVKSTVRQSNRFGRNGPDLRRFFGQPELPTERQSLGQGSGVIVDADNGYIITNNHVVENADEIEITLQDERVLVAKVVGTDPGTDIAVLEVEGKDLTEIAFGDSDLAEVGDFVVAIGNPFGLSHTVTSGIISAQGRTGIGGINAYEDFIQTDASINPGNSGGALINLRGELIGINSAILSNGRAGNIGIGFAIPSNLTQSIMRQLLEHGEVRRGLLGVEIGTVTRDEADELEIDAAGGAMISSVSEDSAASKAGIEVGDIITAVNGKAVDNSVELRNAIGLLGAGEKVKITLFREGKRKTVTATLGSLTSNRGVDGADIHSGLAGAQLAESNQRSNPGIIIESVAEGSPAARYQLREGDRLIAVNQQPIGSIEDLTAVAENSRSLWLMIQRGDVRMMRQVR